MTELDRLRDAVVQAAVELDALFNSGCPYLSDARNKLHQAILAHKKASRQTAGCVSTAPTGCVSDSECAAAGRCLEQSDAHPAPRATAETVRVAVWHTDVEFRFSHITDRASRILVGAGYTRLGTTTLRLDTDAEG